MGKTVNAKIKAIQERLDALEAKWNHAIPLDDMEQEIQRMEWFKKGREAERKEQDQKRREGIDAIYTRLLNVPISEIGVFLYDKGIRAKDLE